MKKIVPIVLTVISSYFLPVVVSAQELNYDINSGYSSNKLSPETEALFNGLGIISCVLVCLTFIILFVIAVWVHRDAKKRNNPKLLLWTIIGMLGPVGLVIYLLVGRNTTSK